jgi:GNAT superfamily N-acetyltransferase
MEDEDDDYAERARQGILAAHAALVDEGALEPLSTDDSETRRWLDCELASLVENRFFQNLDPLTLTDSERSRWEPRASSDEPLSSPHGHAYYRIPYWIRHGGERAGTIALSTSYSGVGMVTVSSLYVLPTHRRRGIAATILKKSHDGVRTHGGRCLRVPAYWSWQPAVRFYLGMGLWLVNWKHSLVFAFKDDLPSFRVDADEREARLSLAHGDRFEPVLRAAKDGDRLLWTELPAYAKWIEERAEIRHRAPGTFALALALRGFPLIRSPERWAERHSWSDGGEPEGLAYKIELFEAWDRKSGWEVRTPSIPGLAYRAWEAID